MSGGMTGACCPDAAEALSRSSVMISFILSTASNETVNTVWTSAYNLFKLH